MNNKKFKIISDKDKKILGSFDLTPEDMANMIVDHATPNEIIHLMTNRFIFRANEMTHDYSNLKIQAIKELKEWLELVKSI